MFLINFCCEYFYQILHFHRVAAVTLICFLSQYFSFGIRRSNFPWVLFPLRFEDILYWPWWLFSHKITFLFVFWSLISLDLKWFSFLSWFFLNLQRFICLFEEIFNCIVWTVFLIWWVTFVRCFFLDRAFRFLTCPDYLTFSCLKFRGITVGQSLITFNFIFYTRS